MTQAFWRDPPWRGGKGGYRMGLRPIDATCWLPDRITADERARKEVLLADPDKLVFAALDSSTTGQQQILDAIEAFIGHRNSARNQRSAEPPLVTASLYVPDDLCLMQLQGGAYHLTAACVCSPSYWHLAEKIGRTLDGIHAPVPTLNGKLGATMVQFFNRLPQTAVFERRNWLIHINDEPFQPVPEAWPTLTEADAAHLVVRSERQTLRRLDETNIVFTIRVSCHPLADIVGYPAAAADLLRAFDSMDATERSATGYTHYGAVVSDFLRATLARCDA
jgi:dimethylamine monooxygenase subunit A